MARVGGSRIRIRRPSSQGEEIDVVVDALIRSITRPQSGDGQTHSDTGFQLTQFPGKW